MRYIILLVSLVMTFSFQQELLSQTRKSNPSKRKTFNLKSPRRSDLKSAKAEIKTDSVQNYNDYEIYWQQVDSLENLKLTRTALGIVEDIYKAAQKEKNNPQIIKSLLVRLVYVKEITPHDLMNVHGELEKEIASSEKPLKNILQVILARTYSDYLHYNSYNIPHRSRLSSRPDDFRKWATKDFESKILELYTDVFSDSELLKKTDLRIYTPIISHPQTFDAKLTPTLYDLLAREAIENLNSILFHFYSRIPEYYDDPALLEDIDSFLRTDLSKDASMPAYLFIENLFREMIKFHKNDVSQGALLYADLYRLDFMHKHSFKEDKDSLYLSSLERLKARYSNESFLPHVYFSLANYYDEKYNIYGGPEYDKSNKEIVENILEISRQMLEKNYSENLNNYAKALKNSILSKTLVFHFEENNLPDLPFRMQVEYRCVDKIFVRFIDHKNVQYEIVKKFRDQDSIQMYYASLPYFFESSYNLPVTNDYNKHNTELAMPPLPEGKYIVLAALDSAYSEVRANQYCWIAVTRLSCIVKCDNNELKIVVLDRLTGKPISGVEVDVNLDENGNILRNHFISDNKGVVIWKDIKLSMFSYEILMKKGLDKCRVTDDSPYDFSSKPGRNKISIYLDRKIYRPGQTVHFKTIVYGGDKKKQEYKVMKDCKLTAVLLNANNKEVQSLSLTTNEFGSAAGQFILPENMMNGSWKIYIDNVGEYFSVEEYKRPAMEITIDKVNRILRTNDTVRVTGRAATFSGAPVSGAEVNYEVVRRAELPFGKWKYYDFNNSSYSSKSGTVKTDEKGNFEVSFIADEDKKLKDKDPVYTFSLTLKITDPSGEVQEASASVRASAKILSAEADLPDIIIKGSEKYRIYTQNLNGGTETSRVDVKVFRLKSPDRVFRNLMWGASDRHSLSEKEFHDKFPLDIYSNEDNYIFWDKEKLVYENSLITTDSSWISFPGIENWLPGKYMMVMTAGDKYGGSTETIKYFTLADNKPGKYLLNDALFMHPLSSKAEPGSTIQIIIGTALEDADIYLEAGCNDEIIEDRILHLNKEQIIYSIPVKNRWRGGIYLKCIVISNNSWYKEGLFIDIPWSNKTAQIKLETFRNMLTPGKDEQWRLRITDYMGKPAEAELLASMYDASLNKLYGLANSWDRSFYHNNHPNNMYSLPDFNSRAIILSLDSYFSGLIGLPENFFFHFNYFGFIQNSIDNFNRYYKSRSYDKLYSNDYLPWLSEMIMRSPRHVSRNITASSSFSVSNAEAAVMKDFISTNEVVVVTKTTGDNTSDDSAPSVRRNLNETAFFYPALVTDDNGDIILNFTSPEALTKWKFQAFTHTKDMEYAYIQKEVITQKELMVKPNHPRFLREGDTIAITARISNLSENKLDGKTYIKLFDGNTMHSADSLFRAEAAMQNFSLEKNESKVFYWKLIVPYNSINVLDYQIFAETDNCSDGEENAVPVLTSSMFITETMPVNLKPLDNRSFSMTRLRDLHSKVQQNYRLTFEYTSNPVWLSLKALPHLMNTPHENSDALFNRYYANSIAGYLMNSNPEIKRVFDKWGENSNAITSNLERNKELKNMLNQECPWAAESVDKANTYRELAGYFNLLKLNAELNVTADKIISGQNQSGAWSWCPGMQDNQFITATIIAGFGHLKHLGINDYSDNQRLEESINKGIRYLNDELMGSHHTSPKHDLTKKLYLNYSYDNMLSLYALSFFKDERMSMSLKGTMKLWMDTVKAAWQGERKNIQAMEALILYRSGDTVSAENIMRAVKENAVIEEDGSMYFKEKSGPYWYETAVESHAVIIEAFEEIMHDSETADRIKNWMLKQKQATSWGTTRATADAIYALLMSGSNWIAESNSPEITVADKPLDLSEMEAGTGYIKKSWMKEEITPEMSQVKLVSNNKAPSWGGLYWQYFENMDKVTEAETDLKINKKLYVKRTSNGEELLIPVGNEANIKVGDEIIVRMEITSGRDMEYVYIKDMRAPGLEPVNVLSGSRYQDGLYYYETTKDASANFYIGSLNKGMYILEYPLRASYKGNYSAGVAVIQSMYAPEFTSHSGGFRITVE